eukprot:g67871.t1
MGSYPNISDSTNREPAVKYYATVPLTDVETTPCYINACLKFIATKGGKRSRLHFLAESFSRKKLMFDDVAS